MILLRFLRDLRKPAPLVHVAIDTAPRVLNVGGGSKRHTPAFALRQLASRFAGHRSEGKTGRCLRRTRIAQLAAGQYDAVYCSHNLEHYYKHDGPKVLTGFLHVLKPDGFAEIRVPDMNSVMKRVVESKLDIEDVLYQSPAAQFRPVTSSMDGQSRLRTPGGFLCPQNWIYDAFSGRHCFFNRDFQTFTCSFRRNVRTEGARLQKGTDHGAARFVCTARLSVMTERLADHPFFVLDRVDPQADCPISKRITAGSAAITANAGSARRLM